MISLHSEVHIFKLYPNIIYTMEESTKKHKILYNIPTTAAKLTWKSLYLINK